MNIYPEITGSKLFPILVLGEDWPISPVSKQHLIATLSREHISYFNLPLSEIKSPQFRRSDLDSASLIIINLPKYDLDFVSGRIDLNLLNAPIFLTLNQADVDIIEWINQKNVSEK